MREITFTDVADHIVNVSHAMDTLHEVTWDDVGDAAIQAVMAFTINKAKPGGAWALMPNDVKIAVARAIAQAMVAQHFVDKQFFDSTRWENCEEHMSWIDEHPAYNNALKQLSEADAFSS